MKWRRLTDAERERLDVLLRIPNARLTFDDRQERKRLFDRAARERLGREEEASRSARRPAGEHFLLDALVDGPRPARELVAEAGSQGITVYRLRRARQKLGIVGFRDPKLGVVWSLPEAA